MITQAENPFPHQAVLSYGAPLPGIAVFESMIAVRSYVIDYLQSYSLGSAFSGCLPLSGPHGGGKTFLLTWLLSEVGQIRHLAPTALYAKAETASAFDLYQQILKNLTRDALAETVRTAIQELAVKQTASALATRDRSLQIRDSGDISEAIAEKSLDADQLYLSLKEKVSLAGNSKGISTRVAEVLSLLDSPVLGSTAFTWLIGDQVEDASAQRFGGPLFGARPIETPGAAATVAVNALSAIAAVYRIANIPLVVLLDQTEKFIGDGDKAGGMAAIKDLVEQLASQSVLLIMAGTSAAWDHLPRDIGPRFLRRDPMSVGVLTMREVQILLDAYLPSGSGISDPALESLWRLSGGNPREVLRIAHRLFRASNGDFSKLTEDLLLAAARDSGSVDDRARLALIKIDAAVAKNGAIGRELHLDGGAFIHRYVEAPSGACLAVVLMMATDAVEEAASGRSLTTLRRQLANLESAPNLVVVAVGYTSSKVRSLVQDIGRVIEFEDPGFESLFASELGRLIMQRPRDISAVTEAAVAQVRAINEQALAERLREVSERLERIEASREETSREAAAHIEQATETLHQPRKAEAEARTRWDLVAQLDELATSLSARVPERIERLTIQRLLVANEAHIKDMSFDYLGSLYLDALDILRSASVGKISGPFIDDRIDELNAFRLSLLTAMRTELTSNRAKSSPAISIGSIPLTREIILGACAGLAVFAYVFAFFAFESMPERLQLYEFPISVFSGLLGAAFAISFINQRSRPERRYVRFYVRIARIRSAVGLTVE